MFGGLEAIQDILGVVAHSRTSSRKAKGKGKGGGPRTYEIQEAEPVSLMHYEHPRVLEYLRDSNAGAKLYLFNSKALGDVAKKIGYSGRKVGSQLTHELIAFLSNPFAVGGATEEAAITASVNGKKTLFLCLVSEEKQLDAVATFHVSEEGIFLSWLVVSSPAQNHRVGTFLVVLIQELVSMVRPGAPDLSTCCIYTQCRSTAYKNLNFYRTRLGFDRLTDDQRPDIEGADWMDDDDNIIYLKSSDQVSIKECSPEHLADATIESISCLVRRRCPWVVGNPPHRSRARWDGTPAWAEYQCSLESDLFGFTKEDEYVYPDPEVLVANEEASPYTTTWDDGVFQSLFPMEPQPFHCWLPLYHQDMADLTRTSWRCLYALFSGDDTDPIGADEVRCLMGALAIMWIYLADLPDAHPYWPVLKQILVRDLLFSMNDDFSYHNEGVEESNRSLPASQHEATVPLLFAERGSYELEEYSIQDCRSIIHARVYRCLLTSVVNPELAEFEVAYLAHVAQVRLFTMTASSSLRYSEPKKKKIGWKLRWDEARLPEQMLEGAAAFGKVYMMANFLGKQCRILSPPNITDPAQLSLTGRFRLVEMEKAGNATMNSEAKGKGKRKGPNKKEKAKSNKKGQKTNEKEKRNEEQKKKATQNRPERRIEDDTDSRDEDADHGSKEDEDSDHGSKKDAGGDDSFPPAEESDGEMEDLKDSITKKFKKKGPSGLPTTIELAELQLSSSRLAQNITALRSSVDIQQRKVYCMESKLKKLKKSKKNSVRRTTLTSQIESCRAKMAHHEQQIQLLKENLTAEATCQTPDGIEGMRYEPGTRRWLVTLKTGQKEVLVSERFVKDHFLDSVVKAVRKHGKLDGHVLLAKDDQVLKRLEEALSEQEWAMVHNLPEYREPGAKQYTIKSLRFHMPSRTWSVRAHETSGSGSTWRTSNESFIEEHFSEEITDGIIDVGTAEVLKKLNQEGALARHTEERDLDESAWVTFWESSHQVRSLRYDPENKGWLGLAKVPMHNTEHQIKLSEEWVAENFPAQFLDTVRENAERGNKYVRLPPGNVFDDNYKDTVPTACLLPNAPVVRYPTSGLDTCLSSSIASALHYVGKPIEAKAVYSYGDNLVRNCSPPNLLNLVIDYTRKLLGRYQPHRIDKECECLLNLSPELKENCLCIVVVLEAADGDCQHAVTVVNKWVFEANAKTALLLCRETLDWCCGGRTLYFKVHRGYGFMLPVHNRCKRLLSSNEDYSPPRKELKRN